MPLGMRWQIDLWWAILYRPETTVNNIIMTIVISTKTSYISGHLPDFWDLPAYLLRHWRHTRRVTRSVFVFTQAWTMPSTHRGRVMKTFNGRFRLKCFTVEYLYVSNFILTNYLVCYADQLTRYILFDPWVLIALDYPWFIANADALNITRRQHVHRFNVLI